MTIKHMKVWVSLVITVLLVSSGLVYANLNDKKVIRSEKIVDSAIDISLSNNFTSTITTNSVSNVISTNVSSSTETTVYSTLNTTIGNLNNSTGYSCGLTYPTTFKIMWDTCQINNLFGPVPSQSIVTNKTYSKNCISLKQSAGLNMICDEDFPDFGQYDWFGGHHITSIKINGDRDAVDCSNSNLGNLHSGTYFAKNGSLITIYTASNGIITGTITSTSGTGYFEACTQANSYMIQGYTSNGGMIKIFDFNLQMHAYYLPSGFTIEPLIHTEYFYDQECKVSSFGCSLEDCPSRMSPDWLACAKFHGYIEPVSSSAQSSITNISSSSSQSSVMSSSSISSSIIP
jgi:hypothetical protein